MGSKSVIFRLQEKIAQIILNRPARMNAIELSIKQGVATALDEVERSADIRVVVFRGEGRAFCAGGDLDAIQEGKSMGSPESLRVSQHLLMRILKLKQIVIAAVHGYAIGAGCNLAMAADLVYAAQGTRFGQAFVKLGLTPDWGGMYLLPRLMGPRRAKECIFFGERFDAAQAMDWGLVNAVLPPERLLPQAMARAEKLAASPWTALSAAKRILDDIAPRGLQEVFTAEVEALRQCKASPDFAEGVAAFLQKRRPNFI